MGFAQHSFLTQDSINDLNSSRFDTAACQQLQEGQEDCWLNLVQALMQELQSNQSKLHQVTADYNHMKADHHRLEEQLEESEATNRALTEASIAQAQQFSGTLKQLRQNQAQIVQSEKMASLGQLVAGVAHEINNPVSFIYGNLSHAVDYIHDLMNLLQLYREHYPDPDTQIQAEIEAIDLDFLTEDLPKLLLSIRVGAKRIQEIVLSLRTFSRIDEAEIKAVNIHEGIDSTLMILQHRLQAQGKRPDIEVVKEYGNLPLVECYAGQLNQVFVNVLVNAIDALDELSATKDWSWNRDERTTPTITIRTSRVDADWVEIVIADNGPDIPEQIQQQIFDPFFTTKPVGKGTGMGMSISYQIIADKHRGKLCCHSSPGQGAEFVIQIPIWQEFQEGSKPASPAVEQE
jgi:signal transduction histidine kinase